MRKPCPNCTRKLLTQSISGPCRKSSVTMRHTSCWKAGYSVSIILRLVRQTMQERLSSLLRSVEETKTMPSITPCSVIQVSRQSTRSNPTYDPFDVVTLLMQCCRMNYLYTLRHKGTGSWLGILCSVLRHQVAPWFVPPSRAHRRDKTRPEVGCSASSGAPGTMRIVWLRGIAIGRLL